MSSVADRKYTLLLRKLIDQKDYWILFFFGVSVKLLYHFTTRSIDSISRPVEGTDMMTFHNRAVSILSGNLTLSSAFYMSPLYPYFLAVVYKLFGINLFPVQVIHYLIGSLSGLIVYRISNYFSSRYISFVITLGYLSYPLLFVFESMQLVETLCIFVNLLVILFLIRHRENSVAPGAKARPSDLLLAGFFSGISILTRGNLLLVVPFIALYLLRAAPCIKQGLNISMIYLVAVGITVSPATVHNYRAEHRFVLVTTNAEANFIIGNNPESKGVFFYPGRAYTLRETVQWMLNNPYAYVAKLTNKIRILLNDYEVSQNFTIDKFLNSSLPVRLVLTFNRFGNLLPLGLAGMIAAWLLRNKYRNLLVVYLFFYSCSIILFFVTSRFRLPIIPVLFIFSGILATYIVKVAADKTYYKIPPLVLLFILMVIVSYSPNATISDMKIRMYARTLYDDGQELVSLGDYHGALAKFKEAAARAPDFTKAWLEAGRMYFFLETYGEAIRSFKQALKLDAALVDTYYNIALCYLKIDDLENARAWCRKCLHFNSADVETLALIAELDLRERTR